MNNPAQLFIPLGKFQEGAPEHIPANLVGKHLELFTNKSHKLYSQLVKTVKKVAGKPKDTQEQLFRFLQGYILAKPYSQQHYLNEINTSLSNEFSSLEKTINNWLDEQFKATHPQLYEKVNALSYNQQHKQFLNFTSNDPETIKAYVDETNACIKDNPLNFFKQVVEDPATIYLIGVQKTQQKLLEANKEKGKLNVGYIRLYAFQEKTKNDATLLVDNVWINNNNKELLCSMLSSVKELANYLETPVLDKAISINYLRTNGNTVDIYEQHEELFKLGNTPEIKRYSDIHIPLDNEGFYLLNKK